jgi:hypothetical protein
VDGSVVDGLESGVPVSEGPREAAGAGVAGDGDVELGQGTEVGGEGESCAGSISS